MVHSCVGNSSPNRKLPLTRMLIRVCNRPLQERHRTGLSREQMSLWLAGYPKNAAPSPSDWGHKRTFRRLRRTSALPPKADIGTQPRDVRFVPKADIACAARRLALRLARSEFLPGVRG